MSAPRHSIFISYRRRETAFAVDQLDRDLKHAKCITLYSPATQIRVSVEAGTGVVSGDRARLLEFQLEP